MNNKLLLSLLLIFLLVLPAVISDGEDKVDVEVIEELKVEDTVDIIVVLDENTIIESDENDIIITDDNWMTEDTAVDTEDIEITHTYSAVMNGFAAEVTEEGLAELQQDTNVEKIYYDRTYVLSLGTSVPQINASTPHNLNINGTNITGAGQTVCIIDTGINYNHTDLGGCFGDGCKVVSGWDMYDNDSDPFDENGHGTHVAGIVAANGAAIGVAPEANLIAMKVFSADRTTTGSKVIAGIDWCVANASVFNISVITMSLSLTDGSNEIIFTSNSACDAYSDGGVVNASNSAAEQGIVVTASAGNDGNTSGIGSPACGSNVTSVGAVGSDDLMTGFGSGSNGFNRGAILDFVAPGGSINSTDEVGDAYVTLSGTSMAAPHVAGVAAVLQQYAQDFENRTLTTVEVEDILNSTAVLVYDALSDLNYTRVDLYSALRSIDTIGPSIISSTSNGSSIEVNSTLNFTIYDLNEIDSLWYNNGTDNLTDAYNTSLNEWFVDANWTAGENNITVYTNDSTANETDIFLTLFINTVPAIDDWLWNQSTNASNTETNITVDENDTITIDVNITDDDIYNTHIYNWTLDGSEINTTQNLTYILGMQSAGEHNLTFNVSDEYSTNSQDWILIVSDPFPLTWNDITNTTSEETVWYYNVSEYLNNPDNDTVTYTVSSGFSISATGEVSRQFYCDESANYTVTVNVTDGTYSNATAFNVEVNNTCDTLADGEACTEDYNCTGSYCIIDICSSTNYYCDGDGSCDSNYNEDEDNCVSDCTSAGTSTGTSTGDTGSAPQAEVYTEPNTTEEENTSTEVVEEVVEETPTDLVTVDEPTTVSESLEDSPEGAFANVLGKLTFDDLDMRKGGSVLAVFIAMVVAILFYSRKAKPGKKISIQGLHPHPEKSEKNSKK
jgi:subtilisin family serine protease